MGGHWALPGQLGLGKTSYQPFENGGGGGGGDFFPSPYKSSRPRKARASMQPPAAGSPGSYWMEVRSCKHWPMDSDSSINVHVMYIHMCVNMYVHYMDIYIYCIYVYTKTYTEKDMCTPMLKGLKAQDAKEGLHVVGILTVSAWHHIGCKCAVFKPDLLPSTRDAPSVDSNRKTRSLQDSGSVRVVHVRPLEGLSLRADGPGDLQEGIPSCYRDHFAPPLNIECTLSP